MRTARFSDSGVGVWPPPLGRPSVGRPPCEQNDRHKQNITLPQPSFADGNNNFLISNVNLCTSENSPALFLCKSLKLVEEKVTGQKIQEYYLEKYYTSRKERNWNVKWVDMYGPLEFHYNSIFFER